jgi:transglutaminase-like putative cysteine protease
MQINIGYEFVYRCAQATPMILNLNVHYSRSLDLLKPDTMIVEPPVPIRTYRDGFGNLCTRLVAPAGRFRVTADALINDTVGMDAFVPLAAQCPVDSLPEEALVYLLGSRYCETDALAAFAWQRFADTAPGWSRAQAICDFVHDHIQFGYPYARPSKTAFDTFNERQGVCRDFAHLAITLCRCVNIPARYCTGYLGDIGIPPSAEPMDFAGWMEVYLGDDWYVFDPRNNQRRIGRVLIARGRDAADVAMSMTFGPNALDSFKVWTAAVSAPMPAV